MAKKKNIIRIVDVTNRDGVQTCKLGLAKLEKTMLNIFLDKMGVFQSEFGFPLTEHETNYLNANLELAKMGVIKNLRLSGWVRAMRSDIEGGLKKVPGLEYINMSISTSPQMLYGKFMGKKKFDDIVEMMTDALKCAKDKGLKAVGVNAEDASRTPIEDLLKFAVAAKENGADRIRYCDTLGYDDPFTIYGRIKRLAEEVNLPIELHCHNDLGMIIGNSVIGAKAAIDAGVDAYINTTVNGMGERAGNADLVSVILAVLKSSGMSDNYILDKNIKVAHSWKLAKYASYAFGVPLPINQVGVGANAFAHESGIHADGALKDSKNYELYDFKELGRGEPDLIETGRQITAGEYSGIKGFRNVYERMEIAFKDEAEAKKILDLVRYANVHTQKPLTVDELKFIAKYPEQAKTIMTVTP
jgi:isopropylmalate/homocitrate/citramalate synthase